MFFYTKIISQKVILILFILFLFTCKKQVSNSNEPFEVYIRNTTHKMCEKLISCYTSITRTFPAELIKQVTIENCESSALLDLDEKISLHTESMKALSKGCYEKLLDSECKDFLTYAYADPSCYMLKKESDTIYAKANLSKRK